MPHTATAPYQVPARWTAEDGGVDGRGIAEMDTTLADVPQHLSNDTDDATLRTNNLVRATFAAAAVTAHARLTGTANNESVHTCMADMLNDMRHLCDVLGLDWHEVSKPYHYAAEIRGEL